MRSRAAKEGKALAERLGLDQPEDMFRLDSATPGLAGSKLDHDFRTTLRP